MMAETDIVLLKQLSYRYAAAIDTCDVDGLLAVFTPGGRLHSYHPDAATPFADLTGHDQLRQIPERMRDMFAQTMHVMTNQLVDISGDNATGQLLCTARHLTKDRENSMNVMIRYIDSYQRLDGDWKIDDRQIRFLWSEQHAAIDSGFGQ